MREYLIPTTTTSGGIALTAATAKTVIEVATGASIDNDWAQLDLWFNGTTSTNSPVIWEVCSYTASGTGTVTTPLKLNDGAQSRAAITTAKTNMTVEGTGTTVLFGGQITPTGAAVIQIPLGLYVYMPASAFRGIRLTAAQGVSVIANLTIIE